MVGKLERIALIAAMLAARDAHAVENGEVGLSVGVPFSTLRGSARIADWFSARVRADLVEDHALRLGAGGEVVWCGSPVMLSSSIDALYAIGFDAAGSWDLELGQRVLADVTDWLRAGGRAAVIGYLGDLPSRRGVIGLVAATIEADIAQSWSVAVELGWIADKHTGMPLASAGLSKRF